MLQLLSERYGSPPPTASLSHCSGRLTPDVQLPVQPRGRPTLLDGVIALSVSADSQRVSRARVG